MHLSISITMDAKRNAILAIRIVINKHKKFMNFLGH